MDGLSVQISCQGATTVALDELQELHHFKTLSDDDYARGRNALTERGFKFPFHIWVDAEGKKWTVDGHQRLRVLKRMRDEGITLPESFPADFIIATSKEDAAKDIVASETKFAEINPSDFTEFLQEYNIDWEDVSLWAEIPGIYYGDEQEKTATANDNADLKEVTCPNCNHRFNI